VKTGCKASLKEYKRINEGTAMNKRIIAGEYVQRISINLSWVNFSDCGFRLLFHKNKKKNTITCSNIKTKYS